MSPWEALHRCSHPSSSLITFNTWFTRSFHSFLSLFLVAHHPPWCSFPMAGTVPPSTSNDLILSTSSLSKRKQSERDSLIFPPWKLSNFPINSLTQHPYWFYCGWSIPTSIKDQPLEFWIPSSCSIKDLSPTIILLPVSLISPSLLGPYHHLANILYYLWS